MKNTFAIAINCIDGRVQIPVIEWIKTNYLVDYVDLITESGPNKLLSENKSTQLIKGVKKRVELSIKKHNPRIIVIVAHADCASNTSSNERQLIQIKSAERTIESWGFDLKVIGLWVDETFDVTKV